MDALPSIIPKSIVEVLNRLENDEDNLFSWKLTQSQDSFSLTVSYKLRAKTPNKAKDNNSEVNGRTTSAKPVRRRRRKKNQSPSALACSRKRHAHFLEKKLAGKPVLTLPEEESITTVPGVPDAVESLCVTELENTSPVGGSNRDLVSLEDPTSSPDSDPDLSINERAFLRKFLDTVNTDSEDSDDDLRVRCTINRSHSTPSEECLAQGHNTVPLVRLDTGPLIPLSDSCHAGQASDTSGPNLCYLTETLIKDGVVAAKAVVPDEEADIKSKLIEWSDKELLNVIFTTGGTGFAPRDVTPEATKSILHKEAPGLTIAMLKSSLDVTPMAMLSRLTCGIRGNTVIINLPGSKKGSEECFRFVLPALPHAVDLLKGSKQQVADTHKIVQTQENLSKTQRKAPSSVTPAKQLKIARKDHAAISANSQKPQVNVETVSGFKGGTNRADKGEDLEPDTADLEGKEKNVTNATEEGQQSRSWYAAGMTVSELLKRRRGTLISNQPGQKESQIDIDELEIEIEEHGEQVNGPHCNKSGDRIRSGKSEHSPRNKAQPERLWYQMPRTRAQRKLYVQHNPSLTDQSSSEINNQRKTNNSKSKFPVHDEQYSDVLSFTTDMYPDCDLADTPIHLLDNSMHIDDSANSKLSQKEPTVSPISSLRDKIRCKIKSHIKPSGSKSISNENSPVDKDLEIVNTDATCSLSENQDSNKESVESDSDTQNDEPAQEYLYTLSCPHEDSGDTSTGHSYQELKDTTTESDNQAISRGKDSSADIVSEMETNGAQILYEFSQVLISRKEKDKNLQSSKVKENDNNKEVTDAEFVKQKNVGKRKQRTTKAIKHKYDETEISFAQVGESAKIFLQKHPLLRGIYLNKGKREVKRRLIQLKRHKNAIDKGSYLRNGKINDKNRIDDMFDYTVEGKKKKDAVDENIGRDEYVVNWYMWCPGHGNCQRQCGGFGSCVKGCLGMRHKQDRHNCSLMLNWKLYLSDLEKWQIHITGSHIPVDSPVTWMLPRTHHQRLDEDTRDLILKYKDKKDTASIEQLLGAKKGTPCGQVIPSVSKIKRFMLNKKKYHLNTKKRKTNAQTKCTASDIEGDLNQNEQDVSEEVTSAPDVEHDIVIDNGIECADSGGGFYEAVQLPVDAQTSANVDVQLPVNAQTSASLPVQLPVNAQTSATVPVQLPVNAQTSANVLPHVISEQDMSMIPPVSVPHIQIHHNATGRDIYINAGDIIPPCGTQPEFVLKPCVTSQQTIMTPEQEHFTGAQAVMPSMPGNQMTCTPPGTIIAGHIQPVFPGEALSVVPQNIPMLGPEFGDIALLFAACQQQQQQQQ